MRHRWLGSERTAARPITPEPTWEVRAVRPAGERLRLWLAADGSVWSRERLRPAPPESQTE
jgi:hypothetical protein